MLQTPHSSHCPILASFVDRLRVTPCPEDRKVPFAHRFNAFDTYAFVLSFSFFKVGAWLVLYDVFDALVSIGSFCL